LAEDVRADACVVGAGIAGLSTAYLLARAGLSVVVLDDGPIGGGETRKTTAHLSNAIDDRYVAIERAHGTAKARLAAASHTAAIAQIEAIVVSEDLACGFERLDGYLFAPPGESTSVLDRELAAAHRAGLAQVERLPRAPLFDFDTGPCLRFPEQGQFHPLKYLRGLAAAIERGGGRIYTGTHVTAIIGGKTATVRTALGSTVSAGAVVVATNSPINDRMSIHTKQAPYTTYVIGALLERKWTVRALYWDTLDPYHYVRFQDLEPDDAGVPPNGTSDDVLLIVGGEDHKTGQDDDQAECYARLEAWALERFPRMAPARFRWSGEVMETIDGLAFIGRNPLDEPNVYVATGDSGMGMTHGTIAGMLLTDLILGRDNPWAELYEPARKPIGAASTFVTENLNVARQYLDWLRPGDPTTLEEIAPGQAARLRQGLSPRAVYRDVDGSLHECSAVCPHLGCLVEWNPSEKTWDCPCHGSRFDRFGGVIHGPANRNLDPITAPGDVGVRRTS
jgi:glycine/D-amino acid oxidase-like deaminating enzyme/nitrite reductase/ring-hydroxylating ferredoxin subunit